LILDGGETAFYIYFEDLSFYNCVAYFFYVLYFSFFWLEFDFYSTGDLFFLPRLFLFKSSLATDYFSNTFVSGHYKSSNLSAA
jgi:hypothetical protein